MVVFEAGQTWKPKSERAVARRIISTEQQPAGLMVTYIEVKPGAIPQQPTAYDNFANWIQAFGATLVDNTTIADH